MGQIYLWGKDEISKNLSIAFNIKKIPLPGFDEKPNGGIGGYVVLVKDKPHLS